MRRCPEGRAEEGSGEDEDQPEYRLCLVGARRFEPGGSLLERDLDWHPLLLLLFTWTNMGLVFCFCFFEASGLETAGGEGGGRGFLVFLPLWMSSAEVMELKLKLELGWLVDGSSESRKVCGRARRTVRNREIGRRLVGGFCLFFFFLFFFFFWGFFFFFFFFFKKKTPT